MKLNALQAAFIKVGVSKPADIPSPVHHSASYEPICPYCKRKAKLVDSTELFPNSAAQEARKYWLCAPCEAWIGCHKPHVGYGDGSRPLGRLANAELRAAKKSLHYWFEQLWQDEPDQRVARTDAYALLARGLDLPAARCQIGDLDLIQCERAELIVREELRLRAGESSLTPAPAPEVQDATLATDGEADRTPADSEPVDAAPEVPVVADQAMDTPPAAATAAVELVSEPPASAVAVEPPSTPSEVVCAHEPAPSPEPVLVPAAADLQQPPTLALAAASPGAPVMDSEVATLRRQVQQTTNMWIAEARAMDTVLEMLGLDPLLARGMDDQVNLDHVRARIKALRASSREATACSSPAPTEQTAGSFSQRS